MSELGRVLLEALAQQAIDERRLEPVRPFDELLARAEYEVDDPQHIGGPWEMLPPRARGRRIRRMRAILDALEAESVDTSTAALLDRVRR